MEYSENENNTFLAFVSIFRRMSIGNYLLKPEKYNIHNNIILQSTLSLRYTPEINTTC